MAAPEIFCDNKSSNIFSDTNCVGKKKFGKSDGQAFERCWFLSEMTQKTVCPFDVCVEKQFVVSCQR